MKIISVVVCCCLLLGCAVSPSESSTEQATLSETQARIQATNDAIAFAYSNGYGGLDSGESEFIVGCGVSQSGVSCCVLETYCCTVFWDIWLSHCWIAN